MYYSYRLQERLAVARIARDDPDLLFPAMIPPLTPACTAIAMRGKLGSEFETKLAIMRQCTSVTDRRTLTS